MIKREAVGRWTKFVCLYVRFYMGIERSLKSGYGSVMPENCGSWVEENVHSQSFQSGIWKENRQLRDLK
jgi:hypothetical protein